MLEAYNADDVFNEWLAGYWKTDITKVNRSLHEKIAVKFLIVWSIMESRCFDGHLNAQSLKPFADKYAHCTAIEDIEPHIEHFYKRYQDEEKVRRLIHVNKLTNVNEQGAVFLEILKRKFDDLSDGEKLYLSIYVVFRYRNNIFHGNKSVEMWLRYEEEIERCIACMRTFVDMNLKSNVET